MNANNFWVASNRICLSSHNDPINSKKDIPLSRAYQIYMQYYIVFYESSIIDYSMHPKFLA